MAQRRSLYDYPSFNKGVTNLANAVFPSGQNQGRQSYYANQAATLKQKGQIRGDEYRARQNLAGDIRSNAGNRPSLADAVLTANNGTLRAMPGTQLSLVANDPNSTPEEIARASVGAGHAMGPDSAYTLKDREHVANRDAVNKTGRAVQVQHAQNQGAAQVQRLKNSGTQSRLEYKTNHPTKLGDVFGYQVQHNQMTPEHAAYLRYGHGPESSKNSGLKPSGQAEYDKIGNQVSQQIDMSLGIKRDKSGNITNTDKVAPLKHQDRTAWDNTAMRLITEANKQGRYLSPAQAVEEARNRVFPQGVHEQPAGNWWWSPDSKVKIPKGSTDLSGGFGTSQTPQPQTPQPQTPQPQTPQPQTPQTDNANASILYKGKTWTPQEVQQTAQANGLTVEHVRQDLLSRGGKIVG